MTEYFEDILSIRFIFFLSFLCFPCVQFVMCFTCRAAVFFASVVKLYEIQSAPLFLIKKLAKFL